MELQVRHVIGIIFIDLSKSLYLGKALYYILPYKDFGFQSRLVVGSVVRLFTDYDRKFDIYLNDSYYPAVYSRGFFYGG